MWGNISRYFNEVAFDIQDRVFSLSYSSSSRAEGFDPEAISTLTVRILEGGRFSPRPARFGTGQGTTTTSPRRSRMFVSRFFPAITSS